MVAVLRLLPIAADGRCDGRDGPWPDETIALLDATRQLYDRERFYCRSLEFISAAAASNATDVPRVTLAN
jgi:hypothetical protein